MPIDAAFSVWDWMHRAEVARLEVCKLSSYDPCE